MDTKLCMRLALLAAAFSVVAAMPAAAADDCKDTVKAEGKPASLRDLGAYPNSLLAWRSAVKDKYGAEYNSWRYSKDSKVDCTEKAGQWTCVRTATPCKDLLSRALGGAAEAIKKDCKSDSLSSYGSKKKAQKDAQEEAQTRRHLFEPVHRNCGSRDNETKKGDCFAFGFGNPTLLLQIRNRQSGQSLG